MHLSILSGILVGTSYIPAPPWAILFSLVPLWFLWVHKKLSLKRIFLYGFITQFVLALIGFHWITHTVIEFGKMPIYMGILALLAFAATQNLHIPLAGVIWKILSKSFKFSKTHSFITIALLTATLENIYPMIFKWNFGYTWFYSSLPIYQIADTIGFQGLSLITFLYNAFIAIIILNFSKKKVIPRFIALALSFGILNMVGYVKQKNWSETDSKVRIGVVQANIGNLEKHMSKYQNESRTKVTNRLLDKYFELTKKLVDEKKPDFIVWAEASFPKSLNQRFLNGYHQKKLINFIKEINTPMVIGGFSTEMDLDKYYNSIFLFSQDGKLLDYYKKMYLLAFGEYLPGSKFFPSLKKYFPEVSDFSKGGVPRVSKLKDVMLGFQICYEGLYPELSAKLSDLEAQVIINVTNDSWFGHTFEPYQHLYMTFARAIEVRIPILRSTNTGISSAILADGTILKKSPQKQEWVYDFEISYNKERTSTIFSKTYQYTPFVPVTILMCLLLFIYTREKIKVSKRRRS